MTEPRAAEPPPLPALPERWGRALCVVAHPDDLEYGAAAAVARWTAQGKEVAYLLVTRGEAGIDGLPPEQAAPLREAEERAGAREVGVRVVEFLDGYVDGVVEYGLGLRRDLARAVRRHRPDVVVGVTSAERFAGGFPNQADHRAVGLALLDAVRDAGNRWVFPELAAEEGLEPWPGVRCVCLSGAPEPTHGVDVTGHVEACTASLAAHRAYLAGLGAGAPDPAGMLRGITDAGGVRLGVESAVLFDVLVLRPLDGDEQTGAGDTSRV